MIENQFPVVTRRSKYLVAYLVMLFGRHFWVRTDLERIGEVYSKQFLGLQSGFAPTCRGNNIISIGVKISGYFVFVWLKSIASHPKSLSLREK